MREFYTGAGIPVARYHLVDDPEGCRSFLEKVGYPVAAKPDNGVGAESTYKITCDEELIAFIDDYPKHLTYIMEEFIHTQVNSYDAIIDSNGEPVFEAGNVTFPSAFDCAEKTYAL